MRLATIRTPDGPRAALFDGSAYIDLHASGAGLPASLRDVIDLGPRALERAAEASRRPNVVRIPAASARLKAPIPDPPKIICLGLNYRDHAAESGAPIPRDPVLFSKYATALIAAEAPVILPPVSNEVDYEAELVVVIGKEGKNIPREAWREYVAGYTIGNDVSARDWQLKKDQKQWMVGKTFDTFAPTGPHLVTPDEVPDPHALGIRLRLNGTVMQNSNTSQMIFSIGEVLAYISQVFTLQVGDLIFTGTPPGVGMARKPPIFLKAGDVMEVEIDQLGMLRNPVVKG